MNPKITSLSLGNAVALKHVAGGKLYGSTGLKNLREEFEYIMDLFKKPIEGREKYFEKLLSNLETMISKNLNSSAIGVCYLNIYGYKIEHTKTECICIFEEAGVDYHASWCESILTQWAKKLGLPDGDYTPNSSMCLEDFETLFIDKEGTYEALYEVLLEGGSPIDLFRDISGLRVVEVNINGQKRLVGLEF